MADCEAILEYVYATCIDRGATWFSYHFTPAFESQTSKKTFIWARDLPFEYQKRYISGNWRDARPGPEVDLRTRAAPRLETTRSTWGSPTPPLRPFFARSNWRERQLGRIRIIRTPQSRRLRLHAVRDRPGGVHPGRIAGSAFATARPICRSARSWTAAAVRCRCRTASAKCSNGWGGARVGRHRHDPRNFA